MKKFLGFSILLVLIIFSCTKKEEGMKLEAGTPAYQLAKELASKLSSLDPDKNNIWVATKYFNITTGEVFQTIQDNYGTRSGQLKTLDTNRLQEFIKQNAQKLAEKKLLLHAAKMAHTTFRQEEADSLLNDQYTRAGSEAKFLEMLKNIGVSIETVKNDIESGLIIKSYLDKALESESEITEEEIQKAYQEDKTASVRHILLSTQGKSDSAKQEIRKKMEGILAQAREGEDFAELAKKYT
ncbi:MAG: peptidylprolyl isomerase, partial [bacterium]